MSNTHLEVNPAQLGIWHPSLAMPAKQRFKIRNYNEIEINKISMLFYTFFLRVFSYCYNSIQDMILRVNSSSNAGDLYFGLL